MINTIQATLAERGERYGEFKHYALLAQGMKSHMRAEPGWHELPADAREALEMIVSKAARIINGDGNHADSWHDIAGYATLVENRIKDD